MRASPFAWAVQGTEKGKTMSTFIVNAYIRSRSMQIKNLKVTVTSIPPRHFRAAAPGFAEGRLDITEIGAVDDMMKLNGASRILIERASDIVGK